jgi:hypothetical protein
MLTQEMYFFISTNKWYSVHMVLLYILQKPIYKIKHVVNNNNMFHPDPVIIMNTHL